MIKTVRGGYDGKGVVMADDLDSAREVVAGYLADGVAVLAEERVAMRRELAALVARSPFGQGAAWPVVETVQRDGICVEVYAPAPGLSDELGSAAQELGLRVANELGVVGVLAVELFETADGKLLVNELAMRPHNSGHWTMDGAVTSQFEQHLRAVLDYPLGDTSAIAPAAVMANVLGRRRRRRCRWTRGCTTSSLGFPTRRCTCTARVNGPGASSGTSTSSARTWTNFASVRCGQRTGCHTASGPTDGMSMPGTNARVGLIMGSDSDWSVMSMRPPRSPSSRCRSRSVWSPRTGPRSACSTTPRPRRTGVSR